jgi:FkbM family methyltransferase
MEAVANTFWDSVCENNVIHVNRAKYPDIRWIDQVWSVWPIFYSELMMIHHLFDDDYCEENCVMVETLFNGAMEGPYCFEDIIIKNGDVVIDAGAYVGDWSAIAAQMGGQVYAFDACQISGVQWMLNEVANLNGFKWFPVGLGESVGIKKIGNQCPGMQEITETGEGTPCQMITVDAFAKKNNLHVDFLKSDIEGYERFLLKGATKVLKEDCPKLAIRTYHTNFGNDREYLPQLIKEINPEYKIINRKKTLYATVER